MAEPRRPHLFSRIAGLARGVRPRGAWWPPRLPGRERVVRNQDAEIARIQLRILTEALDKTGGVAVHEGKGRDDSYLYRPEQVLTLADEVGRVESFFRERTEQFAGEVRTIERIGNVRRLSLPARLDAQGVPETLDELDEALGEGVVRPDHVLYVTPGGSGKLCPADEPETCGVAAPVPGLNPDAGAGRGVKVSVVDTGWWEPAGSSSTTPWLKGVHGDAEHVDPAAIHPYAGHGTFVAGVVRCLAPGTEIEVEGIMPHGGACYESDIARELNEALSDPERPQLISISAGTYTRRNLGLLTFEALSRAFDLEEGEKAPLVVAAAGNDTSTRPFWPAAYPWVVGVGSLDSGGVVSSFSNVGPWVDVYAHGRDLVNAYPVGRYVCHEPPHRGEVRRFDGIARWSGTSFATPVVTGSLAAYMAAHDVHARQAHADLVAAGRHLHDPRAGDIVALGPPFV
ncbi:S8 family peptidase [Nocardioides dongxiaopingii]|uniref:S8 family peptidase n=1 Tax=Nocardioides dongxiaopingii TaxID=2576036 RepID=UPI0010C770EE|nr:S8/S53 family peptidase [Nocardioides dongxiaopingii]